MKYDCLIIDDEKLLADSTAEYFNLFGVNAAVVYTADECRNFFESNSADLLLLDINLGENSGFDLCRELREKISNPILFISARSSDDDKIVALNIGGDDYIQKPYSLGVLLAKVKAVLKRYGQSGTSEYSDGRLTVDFIAKQARKAYFTGIQAACIPYKKRKPGRIQAGAFRQRLGRQIHRGQYPQRTHKKNTRGNRTGSRKSSVYNYSVGRRIQICW